MEAVLVQSGLPVGDFGFWLPVRREFLISKKFKCNSGAQPTFALLDTAGLLAIKRPQLDFDHRSSPSHKHETDSSYNAIPFLYLPAAVSRGQLKFNGTRAETRFLLSAKRTSSFKSAGASVQSATGSRGVLISGSNAGYNMFRGSVKSTGYPLHSPVSPSLPLPCVTVCHHISTGLNHCALYAFVNMKQFSWEAESFSAVQKNSIFVVLGF